MGLGASGFRLQDLPRSTHQTLVSRRKLSSTHEFGDSGVGPTMLEVLEADLLTSEVWTVRSSCSVLKVQRCYCTEDRFKIHSTHEGLYLKIDDCLQPEGLKTGTHSTLPLA